MVQLLLPFLVLQAAGELHHYRLNSHYQTKAGRRPIVSVTTCKTATEDCFQGRAIRQQSWGTIMEVRLDMARIAPQAYKAVMELENFVQASELNKQYIYLLKLRTSQINGCAFCVDLNVKEARKYGLSEQWINLVCVWKETPIFDAKERALLAWAESVTLLSQTGVPDAAYDDLTKHFSHDEIAMLTVAVGTINLWNRLAVAFRFQHPIETALAA
jgi:AhpD family alkylhydroperoxidase